MNLQTALHLVAVLTKFKSDGLGKKTRKSLASAPKK